MLHTLTDPCLKQGKKLCIAWVDYAKAFDTVCRQALWYKIINSGMSSKIANLIRNMYASIKAKVQSNVGISKLFLSFSGVRQGESLSPFLFAIFINDLEKFMEEKGFDPIEIGGDCRLNNLLKLFIILYADNT